MLRYVPFFFLFLSACGFKAKEKTSQPNVILIVADDLNSAAFTNVRQQVKTPRIDKFRASAITFTNAYCQAPLCIPSRASMFTGIYPHRSGVYLNGGDPWNQSEPLIKAETLPELFKRSGYTTFGRGKIYHKPLGDGRLERNFDNRPIYEGGFGPFPDKAHRVHAEKDKFKKFWGVQAFADSLFPDIQNTNAAIEFLTQSHDTPFFMTLGLWRPHTPFTAPQRFFDMYNPEKIEIPKGYLANDIEDIPQAGLDLLDPFGRFEVCGEENKKNWKHFLHGYLACTSFADWNLGRVVEALDNSKHADNTIIIFLSDNGFHCGTKNHWEKNTLWEQSARTPVCIRMPKTSAKGTTIRSMVQLLDLFPSLVDLCDLETPIQQLEGASLRPFLEDSAFTWERPAISSIGKDFVSIRTQNFRFIQYPDLTYELYDHTKDTYEWHNLSGNPDYKEIIEAHKKLVPLSFADELEGRRN